MPYRLTDHWTVGNYLKTFFDYHYCICYDVKKDVAFVWKNPKFKPEDNDVCKVKGKYAPHCALGNTGNVGIAVCCMVGFTTDKKQTKAPLNQKMFELMCKLNAEVAYKFKFKGINEETVFTHSEYDVNHAKSGKIDIDYLPFLPKLKAKEIHKLIREKTQWYFDKIVENGGKLDLI